MTTVSLPSEGLVPGGEFPTDPARMVLLDEVKALPNVDSS
jgi:hypothetical protein